MRKFTIINNNSHLKKIAKHLYKVKVIKSKKEFINKYRNFKLLFLNDNNTKLGKNTLFDSSFEEINRMIIFFEKRYDYEYDDNFFIDEKKSLIEKIYTIIKKII